MSQKNALIGIVLTVSFALPLSSHAQKVGELPTPVAALALARDLKFNARPVASGPVIASAAPDFFIETFFHSKMLDLDPQLGAIAAKIRIRGVPVEHGIPDGSYYLWMGKAPDRLRAALLRMDGGVQTELCAEEQPKGDKSQTNTVRSSKGPLPCDTSKFAAAALPGGALPQPLPPLPRQTPKPPRTQKRHTQQFCYTENGKNPVEKYRNGVVWVPDS